ncbi:hypothetical protein TRVL_08481 [Trypanosoma vivax]|nr:hypothetical protein TRVL_08481 [Trypanosoma vivax]
MISAIQGASSTFPSRFRQQSSGIKSFSRHCWPVVLPAFPCGRSRFPMPKEKPSTRTASGTGLRPRNPMARRNRTGPPFNAQNKLRFGKGVRISFENFSELSLPNAFCMLFARYSAHANTEARRPEVAFVPCPARRRMLCMSRRRCYATLAATVQTTRFPLSFNAFCLPTVSSARLTL